MQVGLQTSTHTRSGGLTSAVRQPGVERPVPVSDKTPVGDYPASPLIATRPQRYSVQLNDQLTTLQQADHWLGQLERALVDYRHAGRRDGSGQAQAASVQSLLEGRMALTGGAVDRQLQPVLQGQPQVHFHAPQLSQTLAAGGPQKLLFSVQSGRKTLLAGLNINDGGDAGQTATKISTALRRVGVQPLKGQEGFTTSEAHWVQLQNSLAVQREGAGQKTAIPVVAHPAQADTLAAALVSGQQTHSVVQETLSQISGQRQQLAVQQEKVRQRIDDMSRFARSQSAVDASARLAGALDEASHNYEVLAQAINGQANLSKLTVRSLLD